MSRTANQKSNFSVRTSRTALGGFLVFALGSSVLKAFGASRVKTSRAVPSARQPLGIAFFSPEEVLRQPESNISLQRQLFFASRKQPLRNDHMQDSTGSPIGRLFKGVSQHSFSPSARVRRDFSPCKSSPDSRYSVPAQKLHDPILLKHNQQHII